MTTSNPSFGIFDDDSTTVGVRLPMVRALLPDERRQPRKREDWGPRRAPFAFVDAGNKCPRCGFSAARCKHANAAMWHRPIVLSLSPSIGAVCWSCFARARRRRRRVANG